MEIVYAKKFCILYSHYERYISETGHPHPQFFKITMHKVEMKMS